MTIIQSRLTSVPPHIVDSDAIQFASRKVAAVSGDARRALDICRRAVEIAEAEGSGNQNTLLATPSKKRKGDRMNGSIDLKVAKVTIATIKQAISEATSSPLQQYLKTLPLAPKVFLAAILARTRTSGVSECMIGDVIEEAKRLGQMSAENPLIQEMLLSDITVALRTPEGNHATPSKKAKAAALVPRILGMGSAAAELAEAGIVGLEGGSGRRGDRVGKVRLSVGEEEVKLALKDDGQVRRLGFAS